MYSLEQLAFEYNRTKRCLTSVKRLNLKTNQTLTHLKLRKVQLFQNKTLSNLGMPPYKLNLQNIFKQKTFPTFW